MKSLNDFIDMLDKKKESLCGHIYSTQKKLEGINYNLNKAYKEEAELHSKLNACYQRGAISRDEIYKIIRYQGKLIYNQQVVRSKISQFLEEESVVNNTLEQYKAELLRTDKKHQKLSLLTKKHHHEKLYKIHLNDDNEIQEIITYDRENHGKNAFTC